MANCDDEIQIIVLHFVTPILNGMAAISMIYPIYLFLKEYTKKRLTTPRTLFLLGTTTFAAIFLYFIDCAIINSVECRNERLYFILRATGYLLYMIQAEMLTVILFLRLTFIFKETAFAINIWTVRSFIGCVIAASSFYIIGATLYVSSEQFNLIGLSMLGLTFLLYILVVIWLNGLFISKLNTVHKLCDKANTDKKLINTITKTSVLSFISTSQIIICMACVLIHGVMRSPVTLILFSTGLVSDCFTNFLAILLSYNHFNAWYLRMCGCCHIRCDAFWENHFKEKIQKNPVNMMKMMQIQSSDDGIEDKTEAVIE